MTTNHDPSVALTGDPQQHPFVFAAAFNSGDPARVEGVYEEGGILVSEPGHPRSGADRTAANGHFLGLGLPIVIRPRHVYVAGDIALLIVDWSIQGRADDGREVHIDGVATDVARCGPDQLWRYVIDNPFGVA